MQIGTRHFVQGKSGKRTVYIQNDLLQVDQHDAVRGALAYRLPFGL